MCAPWLMRITEKILNTDNITVPNLIHNNITMVISGMEFEEDNHQLLPEYLQLFKSYGMKDLLIYIFYGMISSFLMYHIVCGYLQWQYYYMQCDQPHKWKCQPDTFLTPSNERHEIIVGTINILYGGSLSGIVSCWIANGNYTTLYYHPDDYGYLYLIVSIVIVFLYIEAAVYYFHRAMHLPFFYKRIHKHHHRYHSPTPYSAVAMSPIEISCIEIIFVVPLFVIPVYAWAFAANLLYINYYGMIDHSGVILTSWFPWQPDSTFHDNHHK